MISPLTVKLHFIVALGWWLIISQWTAGYTSVSLVSTLTFTNIIVRVVIWDSV
jgi:hypothetical protein